MGIGSGAPEVRDAGKAAVAAESGAGQEPPPFDSERARLNFDIWAKAIETQMHFNDMSTKSRQLGLTFVVSALALAAVMIGRSDDWAVSVLGIYVHAAAIVVAASALALQLVRLLDLRVYHRMLRGAVTFNEQFEDIHIRPLLGDRMAKGMTQAVSHFSRYEDGGFKDGKYFGERRISAEHKIARFYNLTTGILVVTAVAMGYVAHVNASKRAQDATAKPASTRATTQETPTVVTFAPAPTVITIAQSPAVVTVAPSPTVVTAPATVANGTAPTVQKAPPGPTSPPTTRP